MQNEMQCSPDLLKELCEDFFGDLMIWELGYIWVTLKEIISLFKSFQSAGFSLNMIL